MTLLGKVDHLRALLKAELAKQGVVKHWVMEGWKDVIGTQGSSREDDLVALRHVSGSDNVHYTRDGYENLAGSIHGTIHSRESFLRRVMLQEPAQQGAGRPSFGGVS
jgi:hypothetical protein